MEALNPLGLRTIAIGTFAPRLRSLQGRKVAVVDNSKPGAIPLLRGLRSVLEGAGCKVTETPKAHASRGHPELEKIAREHDAVLVVSAIEARARRGVSMTP